MNETSLHTPLSTQEKPAPKRKRKKSEKNLWKRNGVYYFVRMVKGERNPVTLETRDLEVAKAKRDALLAAKDGKEIERVLGRSKKPIATLEEIETAYTAADHPRDKTRAHNLRQLFLVARRGLDRDEVKNLSSSVLTGALVDNYQNDAVARARAAAKEAGLGARETEALVDKAKYSANRVLAQARSVFANEKPFRALQLPASLQEFRDRDEFKITRDLAFRPMSRAEMELFGAKSKALRRLALRAGHAVGPTGSVLGGAEVARGAYLTWLLMRWLGLRNEEVEHCKPAEWIVEKTGRDGKKLHVLRITNYEYFKVKGIGSIRDLPLPTWLLQELREFCGYNAEKKAYAREWLVADTTPTDRFNITHRSVNEWMARVYAVGIRAGKLSKTTEVRTAYDFRKQAGSALLEQGASIVEVSKWLGHRDVNTTTKWYVNLLRELPVLSELSVA
jgi:integrase